MRTEKVSYNVSCYSQLMEHVCLLSPCWKWTWPSCLNVPLTQHSLLTFSFSFSFSFPRVKQVFCWFHLLDDLMRLWVSAIFFSSFLCSPMNIWAIAIIGLWSNWRFVFQERGWNIQDRPCSRLPLWFSEIMGCIHNNYRLSLVTHITVIHRRPEHTFNHKPFSHANIWGRFLNTTLPAED